MKPKITKAGRVWRVEFDGQTVEHSTYEGALALAQLYARLYNVDRSIAEARCIGSDAQFRDRL